MEVSVNKKSKNIEPDNKVIEYSEAAGIPKNMYQLYGAR